MNNEKDPIGAAISKMALRSPSKGFDERLLARLRVERLWRRALGFSVAWSAAGTAAVVAAPFWLGVELPSLTALELKGAAMLVEAVRWASFVGREASSVCAPCLAAELFAASLLAAGAMALLAPKTVHAARRIS